MEVIEIGGYKWTKTIGDEGQDVLVAQFVVEDTKVLGEFPSEELYDMVIDRDTDFYLPPAGIGEDKLTEDRVAFKFRKGTFTQAEQDGAYSGLFDAAAPSDNRGLAAGPRAEKHANRDWVQVAQLQILKWFEEGQQPNLDGTDPVEDIKQRYGGVTPNRGSAWIRMAIEKEYEDYSTFFDDMVDKMRSMPTSEIQDYLKYIRKEFISDASYASLVWSGIAGFYDRYPRIPFGRPTAYTENNLEKFEKCYPFARKLDSEFARLMPLRYAAQKKLADNTDQKFLIGEDTVFTTITVNTTMEDRNARMACHRDAGSLNEGFSNLTVISDGKGDWEGGYLVTPEVRVAINVRPGDLLLVDNMKIVHGNTPIEKKDGVDLMRMSLIFYYRENMKNLGSWDYEALRRTYVKERSVNKEHPLWWSRWNGVSPSMWSDNEWYDYLTDKMGIETLHKYHPETLEVSGSLDDFF